MLAIRAATSESGRFDSFPAMRFGGDHRPVKPRRRPCRAKTQSGTSASWNDKQGYSDCQLLLDEPTSDSERPATTLVPRKDDIRERSNA